MKKTTTLLLLISITSLVWAQPIPPGGIIIAGEVTYLGERVDAVVEVEVPSTGYLEKIHSTFSHMNMNYYMSGVKAGSGDYVIVTATYWGEETTDYVVRGQGSSYTLNLELTDDPRHPPDATTTLPETAPSTTSSIRETTTTETTAETTVETTVETTAQTTIETSAETTAETTAQTTIETTAETTTETLAETTTSPAVESEDNSTLLIGVLAILLIIFFILPLIKVLTRK